MAKPRFTKRRYTEMTLKHLRSLGYEPAVVEKWISVPEHPGGGVRRDLFGVIDVVALHPKLNGVLGVQSTTLANVSGRAAKIRQEPRALLWLRGRNSLLIFGWERFAPRRLSGAPSKALRWRPRVFRFTAESYRNGHGRPEEIEFGRLK